MGGGGYAYTPRAPLHLAYGPVLTALVVFACLVLARFVLLVTAVLLVLFVSFCCFGF